ncbi:MAG TPA: metal ABC transporter ATP-binding protein [Candidatus Cloacimonadota bacterium]|nr:metal ABC transporter ATP-binding protein [Candidatus Cloacimonadota bacterium]
MIEIKDLTYRIKTKTILENISVNIADEEFVAIIGPNGAGKSTLLKLMLSLLPLQEGEIFINQQKHTEYLKSHQLAYLPQKESFVVNFPLKVIDLVLMGRIFNKRHFMRFSKHDKDIAIASLKLLNIEGFQNKFISNLSGGEFQRVLLARALATESNYIFLDEPEAGIDKIGLAGFYELLSKINEQGKTIIAVSHDLDKLSEHCKLVVCLNKTMHCHIKPDNNIKQIVHEFIESAK